MLLKASAPGSLMLLGEYAVLQGKQALVCAIDKRMTVTLSPRQDKKITLASALGHFETDISQLKSVAPFQFVLAVLMTCKLKQGCDITIESEFSSTMGFASSAAVTVATLAAIYAWQTISYSEKQLIRVARKIIRSVQGLGSGADVAACVMGGMVSYRAEPLQAEKLPYMHPITVVYSGSKTPTVEAVRIVEKKFAALPNVYKQICQAIHHGSVEGIHAARTQDWSKLGDIMNIQQGLMDALGVNTDVLHNIVEKLRDSSTVLGAKISGSGLGDCVVALGLEGEIGSVQMTNRGVACEKS